MKQVICLTTEELRSLVQEVIRDELKKVLLYGIKTPEDILTTIEAASYLRRSVSQVRRLVQKGKLIPLNNSKHPYLFRRRNLDQYLENQS